jgi:alanine-glyoxylate transaminase/serine-glyoxylate transaminase/serine-pyruvate transaminase
MLLGALAGAEMAMLDHGVSLEPGSGVAAAQAAWRHGSAAQAKREVAALAA